MVDKDQKLKSLVRSLPIKHILLNPETNSVYYTSGTHLHLKTPQSSIENKLHDRLNLHGIVRHSSYEHASNDFIITYGGNIVFCVDPVNLSVVLKIELDPRIWIKNVLPLENSTNCTNKLIILTFFNEIFIYEIKFNNDRRTRTATFITKIQSSNKFILYSSALQIDPTNSNILEILAGSVFNFINYWRIDLSRNEKLEEETIFEGHKGAIFGIEFLDNFSTKKSNNHYHGQKLFISTSDDRSIRIFNRQSNQELAQLYGHTARVWRAKFIKTKDDKSLIISCAEDQLVIVWDVEDLDDVRILSKFTAHFGRNVWDLFLG